MSDALKETLVKFLEDQGLANVATVENDRPNVSALEFVNEGLTLYFATFPHTQKVENLAHNPAVAVAINGPGRKPEAITGVQYYGRAAQVQDEARREHIKTLFMDKYLLEPSAHWFRDAMLYFEVTPERVDYIDYGKGLGHKDTWRPT